MTDREILTEKVKAMKEKYADVIVKRFIKYKDSTDDCYLIRDGVQIPLAEISDFSSILNSIN